MLSRFDALCNGVVIRKLVSLVLREKFAYFQNYTL
jgi:hypothetical protein